MANENEWKSLKFKAYMARHSGDVAGAIRLMKTAIEQLPQLPHRDDSLAEMLNYLSDLHLLNNDLLAAKQTIQQAIEISEKCKHAHLGDDLLILSRIELAGCEFDEAERSAERALQMHRENGHEHGCKMATEQLHTIRQRRDGT